MFGHLQEICETKSQRVHSAVDQTVEDAFRGKNIKLPKRQRDADVEFAERVQHPKLATNVDKHVRLELKVIVLAKRSRLKVWLLTDIRPTDYRESAQDWVDQRSHA